MELSFKEMRERDRVEVTCRGDPVAKDPYELQGFVEGVKDGHLRIKPDYEKPLVVAPLSDLTIDGHEDDVWHLTYHMGRAEQQRGYCEPRFALSTFALERERPDEQS